MSRSETGVMASRGEPFNTVGLQKSQMSPQPVMQNVRLAFSPDGPALYKPISSTSPSYQSPNGVSSGGVGSEVPAPGGGDSASGINVNVGIGGEPPVKKKRGRPRKYGPEGSLPLALAPHNPAPVSGGFSSPTSGGSGGGAASGGPTSPSHKKSRGRPPGSSNKKYHHFEPLGSAGSGFAPHVITVKAGEDVSSKIMSFLQHGSKALCILSANGAISNVTLRQPATSGGTVTYEGRFEILSLSGSFLLSEVGGQRSRTGGLSVSLSGPDGRVLGGGVAGLLTAASPVQVIVGSFNPDGGRNKEPKSAPNQPEPMYAPSKVSSGGGGIRQSSPPWDGTLSESSGGAGSPLNQGPGPGNNTGPPGMSSMPWK